MKSFVPPPGVAERSGSGSSVGLEFTAGRGLDRQLALDEGSGEFLHVVAGGQLQRVALPTAGTWDTGHIANSAWVNAAGTSPFLPDLGDFEKDQTFTLSCWVRVGDNSNGALLGPHGRVG